MIIACEVAFWVLLAAGLAVRYLLKWRRTSVALLLCEPLLEVVLFVATAVDLRNGAEPSWEHGLAALYIGFTVGYGHYTIRWLDGHAAHRLAGAPRPPKPPRYGLARARHEGRLWLRTVLAAAVALVLLQAAVWYVGDGDGTGPLRSWQWAALRVVAIHGVIALTYLLWPKKPPTGPAARSTEGRTLTGR
ncbi:membrane protein [Streptomyces sp. MMG1121]|nr:membrane protein [Streptomyces sp. MMG1121]